MTAPRLLVLTDRHRSEGAGRALAQTVSAAVDAGAPAILFREKDLTGPDRRALGEAVASACGTADLYVASDPELGAALGACGVHLSAADPWPHTALAVGRSCHDRAELDDAARRRAAYATLSPVFATSSKPGYGPPLGLDGLAELATTTDLPVVALGGITAEDADGCLAAGAAGIAVMGTVMGAEDPGRVVEDLLAALEPA